MFHPRCNSPNWRNYVARWYDMYRKSVAVEGIKTVIAPPPPHFFWKILRKKTYIVGWKHKQIIALCIKGIRVCFQTKVSFYLLLDKFENCSSPLPGSLLNVTPLPLPTVRSTPKTYLHPTVWSIILLGLQSKINWCFVVNQQDFEFHSYLSIHYIFLSKPLLIYKCIIFFFNPHFWPSGFRKSQSIW